MNRQEFENHLKNSTKQGFVTKFSRETRQTLNDLGETVGYRLFLRGFSIQEIREFLLG